MYTVYMYVHVQDVTLVLVHVYSVHVHDVTHVYVPMHMYVTVIICTRAGMEVKN